MGKRSFLLIIQCCVVLGIFLYFLKGRDSVSPSIETKQVVLKVAKTKREEEGNLVDSQGYVSHPVDFKKIEGDQSFEKWVEKKSEGRHRPRLVRNDLGHVVGLENLKIKKVASTEALARSFLRKVVSKLDHMKEAEFDFDSEYESRGALFNTLKGNQTFRGYIVYDSYLSLAHMREKDAVVQMNLEVKSVDSSAMREGISEVEARRILRDYLEAERDQRFSKSSIQLGKSSPKLQIWANTPPHQKVWLIPIMVHRKETKKLEVYQGVVGTQTATVLSLVKKSRS